MKHAGTAPWVQTIPITATGASQYAGSPVPSANTLYRALDVLRMQPYGHQTAFGGRVPGKININTIQDKRVWDALFDAHEPPTAPGSRRTTSTAMWNSLMLSRTYRMERLRRGRQQRPMRETTSRMRALLFCLPYSTPVPGATVYDMNARRTPAAYRTTGRSCRWCATIAGDFSTPAARYAFGTGPVSTTPCFAAIRTPGRPFIARIGSQPDSPVPAGRGRPEDPEQHHDREQRLRGVGHGGVLRGDDAGRHRARGRARGARSTIEVPGDMRQGCSPSWTARRSASTR